MNLQSKVLTIVIPSYNVEKYLPQVIPTYLDQRILGDLEIIIVNDGSKDKTEEIAEKFRSDYQDTIKVINKENGGHGSTINAGICLASGRYFKVIDGDDWVDTEQLVRFINVLKNSSSDMVLTTYNRVNIDNGIIDKYGITYIEEGKQFLLLNVVDNIKNSYAMHSCTFKTSIIKKSKAIDENCFYVDQEYICYPLQYIKTVEYFDIPLYQYRVGNVEQSMSLKNMQKNRNMHKKVIYSLLKILTETNDISAEKLTKYRIGKMSQFQIDIYFSMKEHEELFDFLNEVRKYNYEIYKTIPGKKAFLLRLFGKVGYRIISFL